MREPWQRQCVASGYFGSRHESQYFEVQAPDSDNPAIVPVDGEAAWAQVGKAVEQAWANLQKRAVSTMHTGERNEVNQRLHWKPRWTAGS